MPIMSESQLDDQQVSVRTKRRFVLPRDCIVTVVPAGHRISLPAGERVTITQALGATVTITTSNGEMARLGPEDSIEFGLVDAPDPSTVTSDEPFDEAQVWEAATTVYDPEIPVDIVELGLIYRVDSNELPTGGWHVHIDMTVTAPFCGMGDVLREDLRQAVSALNGVEEVTITLVLDPPWDASRLSDVARLELGMM